MKPLPHRYEVHLRGGPEGYARITSSGLPALWTAPPTEYDGPGDAWSPECLLLAAVETCFLFTLRAVSRLSKVELLDVDIETVGTVDRREGTTRFTEIVLRPRVRVAPGTGRERALRALEKSEKGCLVTASLSTPVRLEPEIQEVEIDDTINLLSTPAAAS